MAGILDGVRVVDVTQALAGPGGTMLLAELGADVIHIEPPPTPESPSTDDGAGRNRAYLNQYRSKRSLSLDLAREEAREVVYELVRGADIFYQSLRFGVAAQLGLDYERIREINPSIVYVEVTANGLEGPDRHRVGYDLVAQAGSGNMTVDPRDPSMPLGQPAPIADVTAVCLGALGAIAALYHRRETGEGQRVSTSLLDGAMLQNILRILSIERVDAGWREPQVVAASAMIEEGDGSYGDVLDVTATVFGGMPTDQDLGPPVSPFGYHVYYRAYRTADGLICIACLNDQQRRLNEVLDLGDPRFDREASEVDLASALGGMKAQAEALFRTKTTAAWLTFLDAHTIACGPIRHTLDLFEDEHLLANDMVQVFDDPYVGPMRMLGHPLHFERTPMTTTRVPRRGEDSGHVLRELGRSDEEIAALRAAGAVFDAPAIE